MRTAPILTTLLSTMGLMTACGPNTGATTTTTGDTEGYCGDTSDEPDQCGDCPSGETPYLCICDYDGGCWRSNLCAPSKASAETECKLAAGCGVNDFLQVQPAVDKDCSDSGSCSTWDPDSEVTYKVKGDFYELDYDFISDLIADPAPLWTCDDAHFSPNAASKYELYSADADELMYELGLRTGDRPTALNGMPLINLDDVSKAFAYLWIATGATSYTLGVEYDCKTGVCTKSLDYELVGAP